MGLLDIFKNVGSAISKAVIEPIGNAIAKAITGKGDAYIPVHPLTDGSTAGNIYNNILGLATIGTAATIAGPAIASAPLKTQVIAGAATLVGVGALSSSSKTADALIKGAVDAPSALTNFGSNVGDVIQNPSVSNILDTVKENPIISAGAAVLGLGAAGIGLGTITSTIASVENTKAERANTAANDNSVLDTSGVPAIASSSMQPDNETLATNNSAIPTATPTTTITTGKKPHRKAKAKQNTSISNKIALVIQNKSVGSEIKRNIREVIYT